MQLAYSDDLNWDVISRSLSYTVDKKEYYVPGKVVQVRQDTNEVVGITSPSYEVFQNSALKGLVTPAVEEGLLEITNMGIIKNGSRVFIQAQMAQSFTVAGEETKGMITLLNAHDASAALAAGVTSHRVICNNTFAQAMTDMSTRFAHNSRIHDNAANITDIINFVNDGMARYSQAVEALARTTATEDDLEVIISQAYGKPVETVRAANSIRTFFRTGLGNEGKTLWDAVNGVTQYTTHNAVKDDSKRFISANFGRNAEVARKAMNTALALVG